MVSTGYMPKIEILLATAADNRCFLAPFSVWTMASKIVGFCLLAPIGLLSHGNDAPTTAQPNRDNPTTAHNMQLNNPMYDMN